jgi:integrase/recombinase XerD
MTHQKLEIKDLLSSFQDYLTYEKGLSENTVEAYKSDIIKFTQYADLNNLNKNVISKYFFELSEFNYSNTSKQRMYSSIKQFLKYLNNSGFVDNFEIENIKFKSELKLPEVLSVSQIDTMINFYDHNSFLNSRNLTIIDFIYSTGCRVSELINVNISDIDTKDSFVRLEGKGSKQRIIPLGSLLINNLTEYIKLRDSIANIKSNKLFLSKSFKKLDRSAIFRIVKSTGLKLGLNVDLHPHTLRHSAATHMLERGCDLRTVQEFLGHSSVSTTQIYTKVTKEFLEEAFTESHPRS